ncbi:MAG TPA: PE family protein, partial [Mycobacterium sp.]|nr:PE family protein [Mycobacterium sp.]
TDSALNGVPNRLFNVFNTGLGTAEQGFNGMLGAENGENLIPGLLTGSAAQPFNDGQIGGVVGIADQGLAAGSDFIGLLAGDS